jgi:hypothetical protein
MKSFKQIINELNIDTLKSHSDKRSKQSMQAWHAARQASKEGDHKKSYELDMKAYKLGQKGRKSAVKAIRKEFPNGNPANDTRGYDKPGRYHGD